jgi:hypothetical protein
MIRIKNITLECECPNCKDTTEINATYEQWRNT